MIQIFGTRKCPDTRKAERFFRERGVAIQVIDLREKGVSPGELRSLARAVPLSELIDTEGKEYERLNLRYIRHNVEEMLLAHPLLFRTPIVRSGPRAAAGYHPEIRQTF
ncbi:MAG TPA: arsenate reductase family protein, partial [candidate division Zixibacteria bacterium]|nr:arsenate reductase family protein [candidate division Zixibacteria bacterium]